MADTDINLRVVYSTNPNSDMRTFNIFRVFNGENEKEELYRFYHPMTGLITGVTTFHRRHPVTSIYETAGQIEWTSNTNATVQFGIDEVSIRDLRKAKKESSKSRRFKAGGSEYKWKIAENEVDLFCVDWLGRTVASWSQERLMLHVAQRAENILDRLVVTLLLHLWMKQRGEW